MQQFFTSIHFCIRNVGYLLILCLPIMTIEIALASLISSLDIQTASGPAALEAINEIIGPVSILVIVSLVLSVALSGGCMIAFRTISDADDNLVSPYQALLIGLKRFFPLLWANILHSFAYGAGFLLLILPGFYLYGRLGLFPLFIMFEEKGAVDSLGKSWNITESEAIKLFALTSVFLGIQIIFGFFANMEAMNSAILFLVASTFLKYATLIPLFYLFYSLYESKKTKQNQY